MPKPEVFAAMAERMNRLPEVEWDRCVLHPDTDAGVVYGWIGRNDGCRDFVVLEFIWGETTGLDDSKLTWFSVGLTTSSAQHSASMGERFGAASGTHRDCERVEHVFGNLVEHKVELAVTVDA